jgi:uncharacterized HhH-GPD family protein
MSDDDWRPKLVEAILKFNDHLTVDASEADGLFCPDPAANSLILQSPFAFLLGVVFDQGIVAEKAWAAPFQLRSRLGFLDPAKLAATDVATISSAIATRPALHRYTTNMARYVHLTAVRVVGQYGGDASAIWSQTSSVRELESRLREFTGIGQKKAAMAVAILTKIFKVPLPDVEQIDVAYDVQVRRVFGRTGLARSDDLMTVLNAAREAYPSFPGRLDYPTWIIGRRWCRPSAPLCGSCPLTEACLKLMVGREAGGQLAMWA